jgi:Secretion system C-terminal sorting domain
MFFYSTAHHAQKVAWETYYGGDKEEVLTDLMATPDNGFLLAGSSISSNTGNKTTANLGDMDYWLWKMDEFGKLEWQKSYGDSNNNILSAIILTQDVGYLLAGTISGNKNETSKELFGGDDIWLVKLNAFGKVEWEKTFGGTGTEKQPNVLQTQDGGYLITASSNSEISGNKTAKSFGSFDYWVIKIDKNGTIQWQESYGGTHSDEVNNLIATPDQGFILAGSSNSQQDTVKTTSAMGFHDYWILKINQNGVVEWQKSYGGSGDDALTKIIKTKDNNYILAGSTNTNSKNTKMEVLKIDPNGTILWQKDFDYGKITLLKTIVENKDETLVIGGFSKVTYAHNDQENLKNLGTQEDYLMLKLDKNGELLWDYTHKNTGKDIVSKIVELKDKSYLLAGNSYLTADAPKNSKRFGYNDFYVVKLADQNQETYTSELLQAAPNPTKGYTNIVIGYAYTTATLKIIDLNGRLLEERTINHRIEPIDLNHLPMGIYLVNVNDGNHNNTVKIIKE